MRGSYCVNVVACVYVCVCANVLLTSEYVHTKDTLTRITKDIKHIDTHHINTHTYTRHIHTHTLAGSASIRTLIPMVLSTHSSPPSTLLIVLSVYNCASSSHPSANAANIDEPCRDGASDGDEEYAEEVR